MRNRAQQPLAPVHLDPVDPRVGGVQHLSAPVPPRHRPPVERLEQCVEIVHHQVDQRGCGPQCLIPGERLTLGDRLLGQLNVPSALASQRAGVRGDIRCRLFGHGVVHRLPGAGHRVRGTDVRAWRHRGDIGRDRDQEPGRGGPGPARPDKDDHRRAGLDDAGVDVTRGIDETTGRTEHQHHEVGVGGVGIVEDLRDELGRRRLNQGVDLGDVHERTPVSGVEVLTSGHRRATQPRQNHAGREQTGRQAVPLDCHRPTVSRRPPERKGANRPTGAALSGPW